MTFHCEQCGERVDWFEVLCDECWRYAEYLKEVDRRLSEGAGPFDEGETDIVFLEEDADTQPVASPPEDF
jgi:hypothetical protein